jgi:hypothetical protein
VTTAEESLDVSGKAIADVVEVGVKSGKAISYPPSS